MKMFPLLKLKICFFVQEMYSKIETNDEGDISMRNVVTHIQI